MLKIKLTRTGKTKEVHYRVVVTEARSKRDGEYIDQIGYYNPRTNPSTLTLDAVKAKDWMKKGAIPTDTVKGLFIKDGILPKDEVVKEKTSKTKTKSEPKSKSSEKK